MSSVDNLLSLTWSDAAREAAAESRRLQHHVNRLSELVDESRRQRAAATVRQVQSKLAYPKAQMLSEHARQLSSKAQDNWDYASHSAASEAHRDASNAYIQAIVKSGNSQEAQDMFREHGQKADFHALMASRLKKS